ncbi:hypothetical protein ISF_09568 [Cordyceps fumosorosea ARSEF 2679]|uniref:Uncharacterized protein n=1 Tax=Cordyceps fumosorosea (strain ARSEF 2679) TaxID=1081104 RepID=A0A167G1H4_CORFA|nr:hypothetical protein ISF_09568 [Cordyceps fumosorosea ARSEF 2679]OAA46034.1 hypothetical protein ISF_09568 [Cordyceps fumosorosea ARSEF 2679]
MEHKRDNGSNNAPNSTEHNDPINDSDPDGYRYKIGGLVDHESFRWFLLINV